jgi:protein TonB
MLSPNQRHARIIALVVVVALVLGALAINNSTDDTTRPQRQAAPIVDSPEYLATAPHTPAKSVPAIKRPRIPVPKQSVWDAVEARIPHVTVKMSAPIPVSHSSPLAIFRRRGGAISTPVLLEPDPDVVYPLDAQNSGTEGTVRLRVEIDKNGFTRNIAVVQSAGRFLDQSALAAVKKWRFSPSRKNNKPIVVQLMIEVAYWLEPVSRTVPRKQGE